jgi:hypothetical protein
LETGQTGANEQAETLAGDVNSVSFSHTARTHKEKVEALSQEKRALYDEIASYAAAQKGAKCILNDRYEEYKQGNNRLVRLEIKRESIVCKFDLPNTDFKNYINENKVSVKQSATSIKIVDEAAVKVAKDSIDIAVKTIEAEKEYKKQLAKERRARKSA